MTADRIPWRELANCTGTDPDLFFERDTIKDAIKICGECPVRQRCFKEAMRSEMSLERKHRWGVFGGKSARERHVLANARYYT